jgi:hypothetical protein
MFCPKCKAEYREGFTMCADCNVKLVNSLDEIKNDKKTDNVLNPKDDNTTFIPVLSTYNLGDIALIKSILDNEGIEYFLQGENTAYIRGYMDPTILMVREDQVPVVRELLKDFKINFTMFSAR